jgi:Ca-activated chloride channel family protein
VSNANRDPMNIALVMDTSGSMSGPPIDRSRDVCLAIAGSLKSGDTVSMATWASSNNVVFEGLAVTQPNEPTLVTACVALAANGGTDLHNGLVEGYRIANQFHVPGQISRVDLMSDGGANMGVTSETLIAANAGVGDAAGIYLVGIGTEDVGVYNDELMDTVTDIGRGAAVFIDSTAEADKMFRTHFTNVMGVAGRAVQVRLDLPSDFRIVRYTAEEIGLNQQDIEPQHIAPNDAMVFHQTLRATQANCVDMTMPITVAIDWKHPLTNVPMHLEETWTLAQLMGNNPSQLRKGHAVYLYTQALKHWRDTPNMPAAILARDMAYTALATADAIYPADPELSEIRSVLDAL